MGTTLLSVSHGRRTSSISRHKHGFHVIIAFIFVIGLVPIFIMLSTEILSSSTSSSSLSNSLFISSRRGQDDTTGLVSVAGWKRDDGAKRTTNHEKDDDTVIGRDHELGIDKGKSRHLTKNQLIAESSYGQSSDSIDSGSMRRHTTLVQSPSRNSKIRPPILKDSLGNFETSPYSNRRAGPGEKGVGVPQNESESYLYQRAFEEYGFNMVISDRISLDRTVADLRDRECKYWHYPTDLPATSVVIIFHNEGWSTLVRTVHSIFNTSPPRLLTEVVLVDDYSDKDHLKDKLDRYILDPRFSGKVRIVRNKKREGLIRSRTIGARSAVGPVVTFMDAHCECAPNWLPPLLTEIALNRTTVVCPTVDAIDAETFAYTSQGDGLCRGAFDWDFWYKRIPVVKSWHRLGLTHLTEPYPSPVMAGGLFAIDRSYFFELRGYDPGLLIWGGENFEISFKAWMCGGSLKFVPCSRIGHIYRKQVPYSYPTSGVDGVSVVDLNYMRVAEVWLDEFKDYFYATKPQLEGKWCGDIRAQVAFRRARCPRSFRWFMEEVAFDTMDEYPPPAKNKIWGEIRSLDSELCLDTNGAQNEALRATVGLEGCHGLGGNQLFRINTAGQFIVEEGFCIFASKSSNPRSRWDSSSTSELQFARCTSDKIPTSAEESKWDYSESRDSIYLGDGRRCLDHNPETNQVFASPCSEGESTQEFRFYKEGIR